MAEHFVLLLMASSRSAWAREVPRLATTGVIAAETVSCISVTEVEQRLAGTRPFSALVIDSSVSGLDRDLVDRAHDSGCPVIIVDDVVSSRTGQQLGADASLPPDFSRVQLLEVLTAAARSIHLGDRGVEVEPVTYELGHMLVVTGTGGTGASTLAAALAQGLGFFHDTVLIDASLHGEQSMLHGTPDVVPGLPELVEAHRHGWPSPDDVRAMTFRIEARGYQLMLGLRRHREWAALRPRAVESALTGMRRAYRVVVADVDADVEGTTETGAVEVQERTHLSRTIMLAADQIMIVAAPGMKGVHALCRTVNDLMQLDVAPEVVIPVFNHAPRHPAIRSELQRATAVLLRDVVGRVEDVAPALFVPFRRSVDAAHRDAERLPAPLPALLAGACHAALARAPSRSGPEPTLVQPGSLGLLERTA